MSQVFSRASCILLVQIENGCTSGTFGGNFIPSGPWVDSEAVSELESESESES